MDIQHSIHVIVDTIINNLFYPCKPAGVDNAISLMAVPCARYPNCIKACIPDCVDKCLCNHRVTPTGFTTRGFKGIANIPAYSNLTGNLLRSWQLGPGASMQTQNNYYQGKMFQPHRP